MAAAVVHKVLVDLEIKKKKKCGSEDEGGTRRGRGGEAAPYGQVLVQKRTTRGAK